MKTTFMKLAKENPSLRKELVPLMKQAASEVELKDIPDDRQEFGKKISRALNRQIDQVFDGIHGIIFVFSNPQGWRVDEKFLKLLVKDPNFRWLGFNDNSLSIGC